MIERLKNCPNCGGILGEDGRCKYCGSKVYDFLTLDFNKGYGEAKGEKTYIRVKYDGKIMLLPIIYINNVSVTVEPITSTYMDEMGLIHTMRHRTYTNMELHFCCGDMVSVEEG